jgi:NAD-dependent deacetylase
MSTSLFPRRLLDRLSCARSVVAFTGAGISAESGVPTFRGNQGIWTKFKPEELASLNAFLSNPALVWEWYSARRKVIGEVQPNAGHKALALMEHRFPSFTVVTQNIDNLHRRAGSTRVFELHGNIERNYCVECETQFKGDEVIFREGIPNCPRCNSLVRPDVVWFGEMLPVDQWEESVKAVETADVVLSIGTSGVVFPAAELPLYARRSGAFTVEINPEETELSSLMDDVVRGKSAIVLPELLEVLERGGAEELRK